MWCIAGVGLSMKGNITLLGHLNMFITEGPVERSTGPLLDGPQTSSLRYEVGEIRCEIRWPNASVFQSWVAYLSQNKATYLL